MKLRSFLAFTIPVAVQASLAAMMKLMAARADGFSWVAPDRLHCTLKFFGAVEETLLAGEITRVIDAVTAEQSPIELHATGIGAFPNWRYPRVIWAGMSGETEAALSLHEKLEHAFAPLGVQQDERAFRLHFTLARAKGRRKGVTELMQLVEKQAGQHFGAVAVDRLTLFKSVLTPNGSIYTPLKVFPLRGTSAKEIP